MIKISFKKEFSILNFIDSSRILKILFFILLLNLNPSIVFSSELESLNRNYCSQKDFLKTIQKTNVQKLKSETLIENSKADYILVLKSKRSMFLMNGDSVIKKYRIALGANPVGPKEKEGDKKTPEGFYHINLKDEINTKYFKALEISYPTQEQVLKAQEKGVSPGGLIRIHGLSQDPEKKSILTGAFALSINVDFSIDDTEEFKLSILDLKKYFESKRHPQFDWTDGCIAVTDKEITEIYELVELNTPIEICP